jgi:hypothetical protein
VQSSAHSDVLDCHFSGNRGQRGGDLVIRNSKVSIRRSTFKQSSSLYGGSIYAEDFSQLDILQSDFRESWAMLGGAMYLIMSELNCSQTKFSRNSGLNSDQLTDSKTHFASFTGEASAGGVIAATLTSIKLVDCVAVSNSAHFGKYICMC